MTKLQSYIFQLDRIEYFTNYELRNSDRSKHQSILDKRQLQIKALKADYGVKESRLIKTN